MNENKIIRQVLATIQTNTKKPEKFLSVQNDAELEIRNSLKNLYDFTKAETNNVKKNNSNHNALPELIIENVDEEHIWQQLELQNESVIPDFITNISHIVAKKNLFKLPITQESENQLEDNNNDDDEQEKEEDQDEDEKVNDEMEYEDEIDSDREIDSKSKTKKMKYKHKKSSIVDDKFFKLNQLDEFLTKEDKKELQNKPDDSDDSSEESIDLFDNYLENDDNDDDDDDDDDDNEDGRMLKYADFFDSPESADDDDDVENVAQDELDSDHDNNDDNIGNKKIKRVKDTDGNNKRVKFNLMNNTDSDFDSVDNDNNKSDVEEEEEEETMETKSSFENRKERVDKKIKELETAAISKKPWQLRGEVTATSRPPNSLLEEYLEFDVTSRPAPIMTETTNLKLEEIIKQRIKDKAWDDVERKIKPIETPMEYKKKLVMDQEKSKKSLSEIYQDAYLKQKQTLDPDNQEREEEESKEFKEIRQGIQSLINKLDALSNYHCTPKPAQPDIKIISNLPAINMEEVAPVATADATLLAPEEIQVKKRGDLIGESERTDTDKNRQRRKKKKVQRLKQKAIENKEKSLIDNKKQGKIVKDVLIKKLTTDRNIRTVSSSNVKTSKSSTDFFAKLQEKSNEKSINNKLDKKKNNNSSAIKYKL
ncbi:U3 small nucleolar ribonucleoprotein protein MPP10 [Microplitis mediator]|uniref:U3 small nucleolar ribonucleoprotein protein MPP10 n=1 Tax=Microplitis mediator TaxID=375433 RepID=UPI002555C48C|nr:U3 small nucleolar ribonucleoprotein protein MPP10 [Microplitis mediator]